MQDDAEGEGPPEPCPNRNGAASTESARPEATLFPARLRLARHRAGLSMRELGQRLHPPVSLQAIGKYENGRMMPSPRVLAGLVQALDVQPVFLLGGRIVSLAAEDSGRRPAATKREIAQLEYLMLAGIEERLSVEAVPPPDPFGSLAGAVVRGQEDIECLARGLRERWQAGAGPLASVRSLLESRGIQVIEGDLPERFSGIPYRAVPGDPHPEARALFVSDHACLERRRLALASELGRRVIRGMDGSGNARARAWQRFGAAFLAPADSLRREAGARRKWIARRELLDLKAHYGIPAVVLLIRLRETGILPRRECERVLKGYARFWREQEPEPAFGGGRAASEEPRLARQVWRALSEERIPAARAAELLRLPVRDVEQEAQAAVSRSSA